MNIPATMDNVVNDITVNNCANANIFAENVIVNPPDNLQAVQAQGDSAEVQADQQSKTTGKKRKGKTSVDGDSGPTTSKRRDSGQEKTQSLAELQGKTLDLFRAKNYSEALRTLEAISRKNQPADQLLNELLMEAECEFRLGRDTAVPNTRLKKGVKKSMSKDIKTIFSLFSLISNGLEDVQSLLLINCLSQQKKLTLTFEKVEFIFPGETEYGRTRGEQQNWISFQLMIKASELISKMAKSETEDCKAIAMYCGMPIANNLLKKFEKGEGKNEKLMYAECLQRLGSNYNELGFFGEGIHFIEKSIAIMKEIFPDKSIRETYSTYRDASVSIGDSYLGMENYPEASNYYRDANFTKINFYKGRDFRSETEGTEMVKLLKSNRKKANDGKQSRRNSSAAKGSKTTKATSIQKEKTKPIEIKIESSD